MLELLICGLDDSYELMGAIRVLSENESPYVSDAYTSIIFLMCSIKFQIQNKANEDKKTEIANADRGLNYMIQLMDMDSDDEVEAGESLTVGMCLFKNKETNEYKISLVIGEGEKTYAKKDLSENALNAQLELLNNKKLIKFLKTYGMLTK